MKRNIALVLVCMAFASCASLRNGNQEGVLHGLVVDAENRPVQDYDFFAGDRFVARTNARGFFEASTSGNAVELTGKKAGWETLAISEATQDFTNLHVYQIRSMGAVCTEIEAALQQKEYARAESLIAGCSPDAGGRERLLLYKSIIAYKTGRFSEAKENAALLSAVILGTETESLRDYRQLLERLGTGKEGGVQ